MKLIGEKYLKFTKQFRQVHHTLRMSRIKNIMQIPKSDLHFQRKFPVYPIQYKWNSKNFPLHVYQWPPQHTSTPAQPTSNNTENSSQTSTQTSAQTSTQTPPNPKALLITFNALNAHTGLSGQMASVLGQQGILTTGFDYPNFGQSHSPDPGHIESVENLIEISEEFLGYVMRRYPGVPVYLNGLSMGGLIAFQVGLRKSQLVDGCILLNPAFRDNPSNNGFLKKVVMLGGMLFPKFQTMKPIRSHSTKHSLRKYKQHDKHMYSGKVWASTTWALLSHMRRVSKGQHFSEFSIPFLCIQGGSDKILDPFTVFQLQQKSKSVDKQIVIIPDLWHALWFDDHHDQVVQMIKQWILARVQNKNPVKNQQNVQRTQQQKQTHHGRHIHQHHHHKNN